MTYFNISLPVSSLVHQQEKYNTFWNLFKLNHFWKIDTISKMELYGDNC